MIDLKPFCIILSGNPICERLSDFVYDVFRLADKNKNCLVNLN